MVIDSVAEGRMEKEGDYPTLMECASDKWKARRLKKFRVP